MFEGIGKIGDYLQQRMLQVKVNYKLQTGRNLDTESKRDDNIVEVMLSSGTEDEDAAKRVSAIKQKLMEGRELSDEELHYLAKNNPDLYDKAVKVKEVRERLRADLKQAKTKAEAQQAVTRAQVELAASAKAELSAAGASAGASGGGGSIQTGTGGGTDAGVSDAAGSADSHTAGADVVPVTAVTAVSGAAQTAVAEAADTELVNAGQQSAACAVDTGTNDKNSVTPVYEKYIMLLRAVQDEWQKFSRSKGYQALPDKK